ncbi:aminotransferase class III-fold pyridoxal phosphate-dependent enzyme [Paludisphaera soli]|uniref:aminotransferase class III-fold pyridoxal phosphate-dependent enzyme n=1 Tax=Paludisphaera soli TaxID=2712865 RepID=UPI0013ECE273|nr:aminotransferase class III-fold pyridoxal phosphate-dependent enzyme [Paludisphaera soli]
MTRPVGFEPPSLAETIEPMLREREPNLLRLYLNPHVAQVCFCLDRYVRSTWPIDEETQTFLANGLDEALGGAIKLVRYNRPPMTRRPGGLIVDPEERLAGFVDEELPDGDRVEFLPGIRSVRGADASELLEACEVGGGLELLVLVAAEGRQLDAQAEAVREIVRRHSPSVIACVDQHGLDALRAGSGGLLGEIVPDVVVFDESFAGRAVPFGAFTARRSLFAPWNRPGKSTFHSTTFQPNTISTRHFMNCLASRDPDFLVRHSEELRAIRDDLARRGEAFGRLYNPSLLRLIRAAGCETKEIRADGGFVSIEGRSVYDVVGGVACSVRGHNPPAYLDELAALPSGEDAETELRERLRTLTGLGEFVPAASGAGAVENALKLALLAQHPRRHVLALKAGFGGKTLLSLTGTANPSYKERIGPLYSDVHYVDPFAPDAWERIESLLREHEIAVVQLELIQSVGGVRPIPDELVRKLDQARRSRGYLLLVDEVQTGMFRTGPFVRSRTLGLTPDLLLLGKGTSDMMFPSALTLYSDEVAARLAARGSTLVDVIRRRQGYDTGLRTILNVLRRAEAIGLDRRVAEAGGRLAQSLADGLGPRAGVREVRAFGLLVGIELDARGGLRRKLRRRLSAFYLLAMLRHRRFPVLAGFCQYEPETLKITPPLEADTEAIDQACRTLVEVLRRPFPAVLLAGLVRLLLSTPIRRRDP